MTESSCKGFRIVQKISYMETTNTETELPAIPKGIGRELKALRKAKGITQSYIGSKLKLSSGQMSLLESDQRTWKWEWINTYRELVGT